MKIKNIVINKKFIGRHHEQTRLNQIGKAHESAIVVVYGRRRIGKTELLEQTYRQRNILKFEGVANKSEPEQRALVMQQLAAYTGEKLLESVAADNWISVFKYIHDRTRTGTWTIYFEELQWLACYEDHFISELKFMWDNHFRHNPNLALILCGSSPSFMINQVMHSKALYNRSQHEFFLRELNLIEAKQILSRRANREIMDAYLTVGGIPEYLKRLNQHSSIILGLCEESFTTNGFFVNEYERIFISNMANNSHYKQIIEFVAKKKFVTRNDILKHLKLSSSGYVSKILQDLQLCQFLKRYAPYNLNENSALARYATSDPYLQFYVKFILPYKTAIQDGAYQQEPSRALKKDSYYKWLGIAFERFCRRYSHVIAKILNFSAINYRSGVFFNRASNQENPGYQIDLVFDRDDNVVSICEIKYLQTTVGTKVIEELEKKLSLFSNPKNKTIEKVLITSLGIDSSLAQRVYFDRVITLDDLFNSHYW